ncbi:MAG: hypothetical protein ACK4FZ_15100 [Vogesella sp.]|uniref:hypothetical protein n=1 Tax=Vogesella sp. TaxID=1904252 RepID=UPI00391DDC97
MGDGFQVDLGGGVAAGQPADTALQGGHVLCGGLLLAGLQRQAFLLAADGGGGGVQLL